MATPADQRLLELLEKWLKSLELHIRYSSLDSDSYASIQPWPWMGATHFRLGAPSKRSSAEMSLHVLAYNLKRMIAILGVQPLIQAMRAA